MKWAISGIAIFLNPLANILIKIGVMDTGDKVNVRITIEVITTPTIIGSILSFVLALTAYGYVLPKVNLSMVYLLMTV